MKTGLRLTALGVSLVAVVLWLFGGAHRGFSRTSEKVEIPDPVTGLTEIRWEKKLVLGVDFLGTALGLSALVFGASWFFRNRSTHNFNSAQPT
jgi:hypothetical protein